MLRAGRIADFPSSKSYGPENIFGSSLINVIKGGRVAGPWRSGDHDKETQLQHHRIAGRTAEEATVLQCHFYHLRPRATSEAGWK